MAPVRRRKLSTTPPLPPPQATASYSALELHPHHPSQNLVTTATPRQLSPVRLQATTATTTTPSRLRSPIRKMAIVGPTALQKQQLIDNLKLELNERVRRLRMQHDIQAQALRHRIEMRINRIPKKMWSVQMKDLLLQHATSTQSAGKTASRLDAHEFVTDVKKMSSRSQEHSTESVIIKKKSTMVLNTEASNTASRSDSPALGKQTSLSNLRSIRSASSLRMENRGISPIKRMESPSKQHPLRNMSPNRSAPSSNEVLEAYEKTPVKMQRSNAVKSRNGSKAPLAGTTGDDAHIVKTITSSGSLKENKIEGINKDRHQTVSKGTKMASVGSAGGRRILRTRK